MKYIKLIVAVIVILLCASCNNAPQEKNIPVSQLHLPDMGVLFEGFETLDSAAHYQKFANKLYRNNRDLKASEMYVYAAWMYGKASMIDSAASMIHLSIDHGMSNPNVLSKFELDELIKPTEHWSTLQPRLDSIRNQLRNIDNFGIQLESMDAFWSYFERAKADTSKSKQVLKEFIFKGPNELRDYYVIRYNSLKAMEAQIIKQTPEYYTYLKTQFDQDSVMALKQQIAGWMQNFKTLYPKAVFPKVYIVPGLLNSGGTASELGMFVGGDMYGKGPEMPQKGMTPWQKNVIGETADMSKLIIHELMHFQQNYSDGNNAENVLGSIFFEGVCDFMVELCTGIELQNDNTAFLEDEDNLKMVCDDFIKDRYTNDFTRWLYNGEIEDRPYDLGYTFGYMISKSYYENHTDKKQAIYELLNTNDYTKIYRNSDYAFLLD